jgi:hypothetical protein
MNKKDDFYTQRELLLRGTGYYKEGPFTRAAGQMVAHTRVVIGGEIKFRPTWKWNPIVVGKIMEETNTMLQLINEQVEESKKTLESLANEVKALSEIVQPELANQIKILRSSRMTMVDEVRQSLQSLRDVRQFFLDKNYDEEMDRLAKFVSVCKQLKELKDNGTLDAVCDSALKLAIKGEDK